MKKLFVKLSMLLLVLGMSTNGAWGQISQLIGGTEGFEDPANWFFVNLNARVSNPNCGTNNPGTVWLVSTEVTETIKKGVSGNDSIMRNHLGLDSMVLSTTTVDAITGEYVMEPVYVMERKAHNPMLRSPEPTIPTEYSAYDWAWDQGYPEGKADAATQENYDADWNTRDWGFVCDAECMEAGNAAASAGYKAGFDWVKSGHYLNNANPVGFADSVSLNGYSLLYAPGMEDIADFGYSSYAYYYGKAQENDGWYFTGWSYTEGESDLGGVVGTADSTMFRVLPASTAGEANKRTEYVYATFKPVLVANYKVGGMINVGTDENDYGETTVVFDAAGERVSGADFTASVAEANFTASITDCTNNKVTVTVRFTNPGELAEDVYRGNVKLASKSGCSELTAAVYARVGSVSETDATLYEGKTPTTTSGSFTAMIAAANGTDKIVVLNRDYTAALDIDATVTIDLNGYNLTNAFTVSGGEVTIAYNKYGGRGTSVAVTGGKLILNGAEFTSLTVSNGATVEQNGALITGAVTNNGTFVATEGHIEGGLSSAATLTINGGTFEGTTAIAVSGGTATINKATISGTEYGIRTTGGTTEITSKLVAVYGGTNAVAGNGGTTQLSNGKYDAPETPLAGTIDLQAGYFKADGEHLGIEVPEGKQVVNVLAGIEFAEGYRYFVGNDASSVGVCRIGTTAYTTLEDALAYANNNTDKNVVIIMTNDYVLPAGYYTLPSNATLIVPMDNEQETGYEIINRVSSNSINRTDYIKPSEFRRLTFASGVNMDVHGTIELTCTQRAADDGYAAMPHGPYGRLVMEEGSHMTLQNGSLLRAWGFMTGKGETDARRGSVVREQFQMADWKGGQKSFDMLDTSKNPNRIFPITQYFIQSVESPVKYHPGAILSTTTSVSAANEAMGVTASANDIIVVGVSGGDPAMFFMDQEADAENTWVRKWYNPETDVQTYDVNSGAHIGSMVLDLGKLGTNPLKMNSGMFVLPITSNMKIHLLSGTMDFTQTTALLAGAEVEVDKESTVTIYDNPDPDVYSGALYIYGAAEWDYFAVGKGDAANTKYTKVVNYAASWNGTPNVRKENVKPGDATINVHGTFATGGGAVYTTESGANIFSTNADAGTFIFTEGAPANSTVALIKNNGNLPGTSTDVVSAKLKNGDDTYTSTEGAGANQSFIYMGGEWKTSESVYNQLLNFDCYTVEANMLTYAGHIYDEDFVKQIAIVEAPDNIAEFLAAKYIAAQYNIDLDANMFVYAKAHFNEDHSGTPYQSLLDQFDQLYPYVEPKKDSLQAAGYDLGDAVQKIYIKPQEWLEIAGQAHVHLDLDYGVIGDFETAFNSLYPDQAVSDYLAYINDNLDKPLLTGVNGNDDHTYSDAAGAGRLFILMKDNCQWWEVEQKDNLYHCIHPLNDTYYYWGEDENGEERWLEKKFNISWKNWDGSIIQTADKDGYLVDNYEVTYGTMAEFLGTNPIREKDADSTYNFTGWKPALGPVTQDVTYTATFQGEERKYTIIFQNEGGTEIERQFLTHNEMPVCENTPTKVGHILQWSPAIGKVVADATYVATWLEEPPTKYEIRFLDYDGTVLQADSVEVGQMPTAPAYPNNKPATVENTYSCSSWDAAIVAVTEAVTYTAVYTPTAKTFTVIFQNEDGSEIERHDYLYGETPVCSTTPTKANTAEFTYSFAWAPQIQTVQAAATYRAVFTPTTNRYTVTLRSNVPGACTFTGVGTYDYNTVVNVVATPAEGYEFVKWQESEGGADLGELTVTGNISLTAVVKETSADLEDLNVGTGTVNVPSAINYMDLTITSNGIDASGQLTGADLITLYGNADYVLQQSFAQRTWYCVAVPWRVDANGGIYIGDATIPAVLGTDIEIVYYDGAVRAAQGPVDACWIYMKDLGSSQMTLQPGRAYMIALYNTTADKLTFRKRAQEPLLTTGTQVQEYGSAIATDGGWNGIANPALFHAYVNAGSTDAAAQRYNATNSSYEWFELDDHKLLVGEPVYVQAPSSKSIVANSANYAPARRNAQEDVKFEVSITNYGSNVYTDHLSIRLNEDKEEETYVIGQDLAKFGVSNKVAQMWINRYDAKLCINTVAPEEEATSFPMSIFAPKSGDYTIAIENSINADDYALYLTHDGEAICNLSEGAYTLGIRQGTDSQYGLRISAKVPQTHTGVDEAIVDAQGETRKVLINNQVFIIRGDKVYSIDGQLVK